MRFVNDNSAMGCGAVWKVWTVLVIQSASLSLNMLFVLFTGAPREKTRGGAETVWSFIFTGERAKTNQEAKVYLILDVH